MGKLVWRKANKDDVGRLCRCWNDELIHFGIVEQLIFKLDSNEFKSAIVKTVEPREKSSVAFKARFGFCEVQDIAPDELELGAGWVGCQARAIRRFYDLNLVQISELMLTSVATLSALERNQERWNQTQVNDFNDAIRKLTEGQS